MKHGTTEAYPVDMSQEAETEISMLLSISFRGVEGSELSKGDLVRMWSLDLQWFSPESSSQLVEKLLRSNWLVGSDNSVSPNRSVSIVQPELGWRPFLDRISHFPSPPDGNLQDSNLKEDCQEPPELVVVGKPLSSELGSLPSSISKMSGLDRAEVVRRAKRKRMALGLVSLRMAMLLLAREQNLEMDDLVGL
jgi:hypothetical protein